MSKVLFQSYDTNAQEERVEVATSIQSVSMAYDGGRLIVSINGATVIETSLAGNDFQVDIG